MNIKLRDVVIFIIALLIGYISYPTTHQVENTQNLMLATPSPTATQANTDAANNTLLCQSDVGQSRLKPSEQETNSISELRTTIEKIERDKCAQDILVATRKSIDSSVANEIELTPEQHRLQQELNNWVTKHQQNLRENLTNNLPAVMLEPMLEQIIKDNPFLNEPTVKQDTITDEQWAYVAEQQLRDFIQQHPLGYNVELFNVVCKQLTCEITGKELQFGSWQQVFIALSTHLIQSGRQRVSDNGKILYYQHEGLVYFYTQIIFLEHPIQ